ncbi:MBL fold metallo-hydrolase [Parasphingopyxis lamellibrachiae]|uniref:Glyoxylase-like metal-dependent hydrolase (Beta-lactamase superfamily II) n=1 Tax=Parasphingopyxis lamellibrachiae TaxID=680125 RepID=A0A3D9FD52_9SPHN|nr:MBL fold metallo-hydrolase [Parasphingopyxis lamellibrachiae]RED15744.1 glyoxylase-like metal-dependent hydrolase (beta-lactamase superfamily II) [Parasphingopyxis lamellibrachiae]
MTSQSWTYAKGLHDLGHGSWAWLQPDGGWGWSNAGLIVDGDQSLLVDTLFDARLTAAMLDAMSDATGLSGDDIGTVVNTHANGDHTHGNGLCRHAEIIASEASAKEMAEVDAAMLHTMMTAAPNLGPSGKYLLDIFGNFDFANVAERAPTRTFTGELGLRIGDKPVSLIEVGPAHTAGDVLVHLPEDRIVYTGDILFIDGTPIMWAGPVGNWIAACDKILAMDVEAIVPGHGPITDKAGVRKVQTYLRYIDHEARKRFEAGLSVRDAAHDIALGDYASWIDSERIAVNVDTLYREYRGDTSPPNIVALFSLMAELKR